MAVLLMAVLVNAGATPTSSAQAEIQAAYDRMSAAATRRDVDGWLALKTPDFVSVSLDGKESSLDGRRAMMKLVFATVQSVKAKTRILGFRLLAPDRALAVIHEHTEMRFMKPDKHESTMVIDTDAESTWVKTAAGWREKRSRSLKEKGTLDGKPM